MMGIYDLLSGNCVVYIDPRTQQQEVGLFVKINKFHVNTHTDITILDLTGKKTTIKESCIEWDKTAFLNEMGASS